MAVATTMATTMATAMVVAVLPSLRVWVPTIIVADCSHLSAPTPPYHSGIYHIKSHQTHMHTTYLILCNLRRSMIVLLSSIGTYTAIPLRYHITPYHMHTIYLALCNLRRSMIGLLSSIGTYTAIPLRYHITPYIHTQPN